MSDKPDLCQDTPIFKFCKRIESIIGLVDNQVELPNEAKRILYDNLFELYTDYGGGADTRKDSAASRDTGELSTPTPDLRELAGRIYNLVPDDEERSVADYDAIEVELTKVWKQSYALGRKQGLEEALAILRKHYPYDWYAMDGYNDIHWEAEAIRKLMLEE